MIPKKLLAPGLSSITGSSRLLDGSVCPAEVLGMKDVLCCSVFSTQLQLERLLPMLVADTGGEACLREGAVSGTRCQCALEPDVHLQPRVSSSVLQWSCGS